MATCPRCRTSGAVSVTFHLVARPLGTWSLAGVQLKTSAVLTARADCASCGLSVPGHLEDATTAPDGHTLTGGRFVADRDWKEC